MVKSASVNNVAAWEHIRPAQLEGSRVIKDRLFIADVIKREGVEDDWKEIERMADLVSPGERLGEAVTFHVTDFQQKRKRFLDKVWALALRELKMSA